MTHHPILSFFRARSLLLAAALIVPGALLCALSAGQEHTAPGARGATASQKYKNIQILKNLPADQLIPTMRNFNASLGVRCDFCHVVNADHTGFELDTKPTKRMARKMILLAENLNAHQRILDRKATCFMCHHGHAEPETQAPPEEPRP